MRARLLLYSGWLGIVLAGAWTAACGTGSNSIATPSAANVGVAIHGKVTTSGSGGSNQGFGAALASSAVRVSVVGTGQSTTADSRGRFSLTSVRAGEVTLRFQAAGVDARLSLGGLLDGQVITISVLASGSEARLSSDSGGSDDDESSGGGEVEFSGLVDSIAPPRLVVAGRSVLTDANTEFKGKGKLDSLADLNVGDEVEVEGLESSPGIVLALEIHRLEEAGDDEEEDEDDDEEDDDDDEDDEEDDDDDINS